MLPHLAHATVVNFFSKLRERTYHVIETITFEGIVHGTTDIIEIDECYFGKKRKGNRGNSTTRQWVFGIVQRGTRKSFLVPVNNRTKETLIPLIKARVKSGSTIYHDDWPAYRLLSEEGYQTGVVNHTKEFVSKEGVCTNTIEGEGNTLDPFVSL